MQHKSNYVAQYTSSMQPLQWATARPCATPWEAWPGLLLL